MSNCVPSGGARNWVKKSAPSRPFSVRRRRLRGVEVLDEQLAPELGEALDVAADRRSEIEDVQLAPRGQGREDGRQGQGTVNLRTALRDLRRPALGGRLLAGEPAHPAWAGRFAPAGLSPARAGVRGADPARRMAPCDPAPCPLRLHVDRPLEPGAVLQDHPRRGDVAADRAGLAQHRLLLGENVAVHLALDRHHPSEDVGLDLAVAAHGHIVLLEVDLPLDAPFDHQILVTGQIAFDEDGGADGRPVAGPAWRLRSAGRCGGRGRGREGMRSGRGRLRRMVAGRIVTSLLDQAMGVSFESSKSRVWAERAEVKDKIAGRLFEKKTFSVAPDRKPAPRSTRRAGRGPDQPARRAFREMSTPASACETGHPPWPSGPSPGRWRRRGPAPRTRCRARCG